MHWGEALSRGFKLQNPESEGDTEKASFCVQGLAQTIVIASSWTIVNSFGGHYFEPRDVSRDHWLNPVTNHVTIGCISRDTTNGSRGYYDPTMNISFGLLSSPRRTKVTLPSISSVNDCPYCVCSFAMRAFVWWRKRVSRCVSTSLCAFVFPF